MPDHGPVVLLSWPTRRLELLVGTCQWDGNIFLEPNSTMLDADTQALKQRHSRAQR